jgi:hypothetical protein
MIDGYIKMLRILVGLAEASPSAATGAAAEEA